jgi:YegS/Rv2252/BmrU family lipid kinase
LPQTTLALDHAQPFSAVHERHELPVVVNSAAGTGYSAEEVSALELAFREADGRARIVEVGRGMDIRTVADRLVRENPPAVVAAGGDGTVSAIAAALAGTDIPLGVLPMGTLNHFARDLLIPQTLADAARTIVEGHTVEIDVAEVNGRVFINNSSIGLYPHIVRRREQQQRLGRGKWIALAWATWTTLRSHPSMTVRVATDSTERQCRASFIFIGNNQYAMEGFDIGLRARLDQGCLSLYICQRAGRFGLIALALRALFGRLQQARDFTALTAERLVVETRRRTLSVATDGEVTVLDTPLEYRIHKGALRVLVPRG